MELIQEFEFVPATANQKCVDTLRAEIEHLVNYDVALPEYKALFRELGVDKFLQKFELYLPLDQYRTLQADHPPTWDYWLWTPPALEMLQREVLKDYYAIYNVAMEHPVLREKRLYIGSGSSTSGAASRIGQWSAGQVMPMRVSQFLEKGFKIVHIGLLALIKKPKRSEHALGRVWVLTLEARYTFRFWSMYQKEREVRSGHHYGERLCSWDIGILEWHGLNTHTALREAVADLPLDLSEESLALYEREVEARIQRSKAARLAYTKAYEKSDRGKATKKAWRATPKARENELNRIASGQASGYYKKYSKTEKGKATRHRSNNSEKGKAGRKRYEQSEKGKAATRRKKSSAKGKASQKRYNDSEKGKAARKKYAQSAKGKAAQKKFEMKKRNGAGSNSVD